MKYSIRCLRSNGRSSWSPHAFLLVLGLVACSKKEHPSSEPSPTIEAYPIATPVLADKVHELEFVAEVRAVKYAEIRARIGGILETVAVDEGQSVKTGQLLFKIHARDLAQELAAAKAASQGAEAELHAAKLDQENIRLLFEKEVVSPAELAMAEAKVKTLEARLGELQATVGRVAVALGYAQISAPFAGVLNRIPNKAGSAVGEEQLLTTLADTTQVYAYFRVTERDYFSKSFKELVELGKSVGLRLIDGSTFPAEGHIDAVENEVDRATGSITLRAVFPNAEAILKHGSSAKVILRSHLKQALVVPQSATFEVQGDLHLFIVDEADVVHARRIVPKLRLNRDFVIESGLASTERFVAAGAQRLREGSKIRALSTASATNGG